MSLTFGFYNSINGDRKYDAKQLAAIFDGVFTSGIFPNIGNEFAIAINSGMTINVGSGRAWFNHTWTDSDSTIPLTLDAAEVVLNRIDRIILEIDTTVEVRTNTIRILKGTPSSSPVAPTLSTNNGKYQYAFADIYVGAGVTSIVDGNITRYIGTGSCPFVGAVMETSVGTTANLIVKTAANGILTALPAGTITQYLRGDGVWSAIDLTQFATIAAVSAANSSLIKSALNAGGNPNIYACRAWCAFDATTNTILGSGGVSSVSFGGASNTVNLSVAMPDTNYSVAYSCQQVNNSATAGGDTTNGTVNGRSTTGVVLYSATGGHNNSYNQGVASPYNAMSVFR